MTQSISAIALFCEDIREEKGGSFTLVGLMPDNVQMKMRSVSPKGDEINPIDSKLLRKLCIFIRMNFDPEDEFEHVLLKLVFPDGEQDTVGEFPPELIQRAKKEAKDKGNPITGVIARTEFVGMKLSKLGLLKLVLEVEGRELVAGFINIKPAPEENKEKN